MFLLKTKHQSLLTSHKGKFYSKICFLQSSLINYTESNGRRLEFGQLHLLIVGERWRQIFFYLRIHFPHFGTKLMAGVWKHTKLSSQFSHQTQKRVPTTAPQSAHCIEGKRDSYLSRVDGGMKEDKTLQEKRTVTGGC